MIKSLLMWGTVALWALGTASAQSSSPASRASAFHAEPGDRVVFHMVGEIGLSDTVNVNERGEIPLPRIGVVPVASLSISALEDTLRSRYAKFYRTPAIEIVVLRRVLVGGEVVRPNVYFVDVSTTLREAIARAGGLNDAANRNAVWIVRNGTRTAVPDWEGDDSRIWDLRSGDQVIVGRKSWLALNAIAAASTAAVLVSLFLSLRR